MGCGTVSLCVWLISLHYLWLVPLPFSKDFFLPRKKIKTKREDDKKYEALSLSNHWLLRCFHLMLIVDWLPATAFTGMDWKVARQDVTQIMCVGLNLYLQWEWAPKVITHFCSLFSILGNLLLTYMYFLCLVGCRPLQSKTERALDQWEGNWTLVAVNPLGQYSLSDSAELSHRGKFITLTSSSHCALKLLFLFIWIISDAMSIYWFTDKWNQMLTFIYSIWQGSRRMFFFGPAAVICLLFSCFYHTCKMINKHMFCNSLSMYWQGYWKGRMDRILLF